MALISEQDIVTFIENKVNLKKKQWDVYRAQIEHFKDNLEEYIKGNPEFELIKILNSGSCAKKTAISMLNDIDIAVYIRPEKISEQRLNSVLQYLRDLLATAYDKYGMSSDQFSIGDHCVKVSFKGSGLDIDVVPVIPSGKPDDRGLIPSSTGNEWLETSIPLHLSFISIRKKSYLKYAPLVRLTKWWREQAGLRLKSFLIELIWAHLVDTEERLPNSYKDAFPYFFVYILRTQLQERIIFSDYYTPTEIKPSGDSVVEIYDPVNPSNNVAEGITKSNRNEIVSKAQEAFDDLSMAISAHNKEKGLEYWKHVLGNSFVV